MLPLPTTRQSETEDQLEQLLGPIALYPDAVNRELFWPASTNSPDIVLAARLFEHGV